MISEWVKAARANSGKSQEALAQDLEVTKGNISAWENDRHRPDMGDVIQISLATQYPVPDEVRQQLRHALSIAEGQPEPNHLGVRVPLLANSDSLGRAESQIDTDVLVGEIFIESHFARQLPLSKTSELKFLHAFGDHMSPTFNSGDVLLIDTSVHDASTDGVYVLKADDRLVVKRVSKRLDGCFEVSSDNPVYKSTEVFENGFQGPVIGRVVFYWNGRRVV